MRLVGYGKEGPGTFDARQEAEVASKRIFEFDLGSKDYILRFYMMWEKVLGQYIIEVKGKRYIIPSGMYIYCGDINGSVDWILVDEVINRDIMAFQMNTDFGAYGIEPIGLHATCEIPVFLPDTKNPIPIADMSGQSCIIISRHDMYHKTSEFEYDALFIS